MAAAVAALFTVLVPPVKFAIGSRFAPDCRFAGRVNDRFTSELACPVTSQRPALVPSVARTVLAMPGNTLLKFRPCALDTLIACCTVAVAVMLALLTCAWAAVPRTESASAARVSLEAVFIGIPLSVSSCGTGCIFKGLLGGPVASAQQGQGTCHLASS